MIRDEVLIKHIRDAISTIEFYVKDMKQNDFLSKENNRTQDAVIRQFEIIGEATGRLSEAIKKDYPDLPWKMIASGIWELKNEATWYQALGHYDAEYDTARRVLNGQW